MVCTLTKLFLVTLNVFQISIKGITCDLYYLEIVQEPRKIRRSILKYLVMFHYESSFCNFGFMNLTAQLFNYKIVLKTFVQNSLHYFFLKLVTN